MSSEIWLIGEGKPDWCQQILPTNRNILQVLYFYLNKKKLSLSESFNMVSSTLEKQWIRFNLDRMLKGRITRKVKKLQNNHINLRKSQNKQTQDFLSKKTIYSNQLDSMFDISVNKTVKNIKSRKMIRFFMDQKTNRRYKASDLNLNLISGNFL